MKFEVNPDVRKFHEECIVADLHADTWLANYLTGYDIRKRHRRYIPTNPFLNHIDIPRAREGGLDITGQGVVTHPFWHRSGKTQCWRMIKRILKGIDRNATNLELALSGTHAEEIVKKGKMAVFIGIEGAHALSGDLNLLEDFRALGVRYLTLVHFTRNEAGVPSIKERMAHLPLPPFGKELVQECERLKVMVDIAHLAEGCFWDVLKISKKPIFASHIGMRGLNDHWRNISDEQTRAVADSGGVIGIMFSPGFLGKRYWRCSLDLVIDHIEHCMKVAGEDHVALGSDWDGFITTPEGLEDVTGLPNITQKLFDRGHKKETIKKVLGLNFLRMFKQVCG